MPRGWRGISARWRGASRPSALSGSLDLEQWPQRPHVAELLDRIRGLYERFGFLAANDWCDEVARLGDDFSSRHGIAQGSPHCVDSLRELRAVGKEHLHDRNASRQKFRQLHRAGAE